MSENEFPKTLHSTEDRQVVSLSESFSSDEMRHVHAALHANGAKVAKYGPDYTLDLNLDDRQMDALCSAWLAFRGAQWLAEMEEKRRQEERLHEAYEMAFPYPEIVIENLASSHWMVSIPELGYGFELSAWDVDTLYEQVSVCVERWGDHLKIRAEIEQAKELAAATAGMEITGDGDPWYSIEQDGERLQSWIRAEDLLKRTKSWLATVQAIA
jgi:hypothetical protein